MTHFEQCVIQRLDKIIKLLEKQAAAGISIREYSAISSEPICNCRKHKRGYSTGGWICPEHGQQF